MIIELTYGVCGMKSATQGGIGHQLMSSLTLASYPESDYPNELTGINAFVMDSGNGIANFVIRR